MIAYIKQIFSSDGSASFARWSTLLTVITGCYSLVHVVRHSHTIPDAATLIGLGAFMTAPYAIGKVTQGFGPKPAGDPGTVGTIQASAADHPHQAELGIFVRRG